MRNPQTGLGAVLRDPISISILLIICAVAIVASSYHSKKNKTMNHAVDSHMEGFDRRTCALYARLVADGTMEAGDSAFAECPR